MNTHCPNDSPGWLQRIHQAHKLYCELTGQSLSLRYDREAGWLGLLKLGFTLEDIRRVVVYLQGEIRMQRRNVGALKLTNLLQPDRFEEDLAISRIRLRTRSPKSSPPPCLEQPRLSPEQREAGRRRALDHLRRLREGLR